MTLAPKPPTAADPQALRADIAETRAELGDSVDALAAKTDVTGRTGTALAERRQAATAAITRATTTLREKSAPAVEKARGYAVKARTAATGTSPRTRIGVGAAAGTALTALLVVRTVRRRRRAQARWYRRIGRR